MRVNAFSYHTRSAHNGHTFLFSFLEDGPRNLGIHVRANLDTVREGVDVRGESLLDFLQNSPVFFGGNETDRQPFGTEASSTADTVKVLVRYLREVVVDDNVDAFNIHTTPEQVSGH